MRKTIVIIASAALGFAAASAGLANEDLAKKSGCMGCHDVNAKKVGPSFKSVAEKYKGKDGAADQLVGKLTKGHGGKKPSADDAKAIVDWILGMA